MKATYNHQVGRRMMVVATIVLFFCVSSVFGETFPCSICVGSSGWSNNGEGTVPECNTRISTRTLGSCTSASTTASCTENSKATKFTITYRPDYGTLCYLGCVAAEVCCKLACEGDIACLEECDNQAYVCKLSCVEDCIIVDQEYSDYATGCI
jgi:hypothetical protein